jgi:glycosyltransferase involved in cell wall biosynthesis
MNGIDMRILHITATYPPSINGVAVSCQRTIEQLRVQGEEVYLVAPKHKGRVTTEVDIELPSIPNPVVKDYPVSLPLPYQLVTRKINQIQGGIDVVHVHHPFTIGSLAKKIANDYKIPLVFTHHTKYADYSNSYAPFFPGNSSELLVNRSVRKFCNTCDVVIAPTASIQVDLKKVVSTRIVTISTAGIREDMRIKGDKSSLRKKLHLPDKKVVLTVTRITKEKNIDRLIEIAKLLQRQNLNKYILVIVGVGPELESVQEEIIKNKLEDYVLMAGKKTQEELKEFYSAADIFLYLTLTDTLGITLIEAMSASLPIVAVNAPNTRDILKGQLGGRLVLDRSADYLEAIEKIMSDRETLLEMGRANYRLSRQYVIAKTTKDLVGLYRDLQREN